MFKIFLIVFPLFMLLGCNGGESDTPSETPSDTPSTNNILNNLQQESDTEIKHSLNDNEEDESFIPLSNTLDITDKQYFRVLSPKSCTQNHKNRFIYQVMHDSYLWANDVPELDYTDNQYNSSQKMLDALKSTHDKFSFIIDAQVAQSFFEEGKNEDLGLGLTIAPLDAKNYLLVVTYIYPNSPADKQGITRGDLISYVENKNITKENIDAIVDILTNQKSIEFSFLQQNGTVLKKNISKKSYDIQTVLYDNMFTHPNNNKKVGYLVFQDFIQNAMSELDTSFKNFKDNGVNELILDLRYNGGGATNVANHLASLIGGVNVSENIFNKVNFNEQYSQYNEIDYFEKLQTNALNLNRVFVISTEATCSSSELVINSLRASANNIEVIQIGSKTCGKPYGFLGSGKFCDKALYAINVESKNGDDVESKNGDDVGGYIKGLSPTCLADDNIFKAFGDTEETSLNAALYYISNNKCSTSNNTIQKRQVKSDLKLPQDGFKRIMSAY